MRRWGKVRRREAALSARCAKWARARGVPVAKLSECAGMLDRIFFVPGGRPLVPEFKDPDATTERGHEEAQDWYIAKLRENGYAAAYVDSFEVFVKLMRKKGIR